MWNEHNCTVEHSLASPFFGVGVKTNLRGSKIHRESKTRILIGSIPLDTVTQASSYSRTPVESPRVWAKAGLETCLFRDLPGNEKAMPFSPSLPGWQLPVLLVPGVYSVDPSQSTDTLLVELHHENHSHRWQDNNWDNTYKQSIQQIVTIIIIHSEQRCFFFAVYHKYLNKRQGNCAWRIFREYMNSWTNSVFTGLRLFSPHLSLPFFI